LTTNTNAMGGGGGGNEIAYCLNIDLY